MSAELTGLLAKQAITEQIYNYCRALDRMDKPLAYQVWHEGGLADYGTIFNGTGAGFIDMVFESHKKRVAHSHQISNILMKIDGHGAASESYVSASLRNDRDGVKSQMISRGRYADKWSFRDGRWAIDHRIYVHDFDVLVPVPAGDIPGWGRRDREDPSYRFM